MPYGFIDLATQTHTDQFVENIHAGLTAIPKYLSVKYLYDVVGSGKLGT